MRTFFGHPKRVVVLQGCLLMLHTAMWWFMFIMSFVQCDEFEMCAYLILYLPFYWCILASFTAAPYIAKQILSYNSIIAIPVASYIMYLVTAVIINVSISAFSSFSIQVQDMVDHNPDELHVMGVNLLAVMYAVVLAVHVSAVLLITEVAAFRKGMDK